MRLPSKPLHNITSYTLLFGLLVTLSACVQINDFQINYYNVRQLAILSANAYLQQSEFRESDATFVSDLSIDNDSVRALLFNLHETYVIAIKGTSLYSLTSRANSDSFSIAEVSKNVCTDLNHTCADLSHHYLDKLNDNMLFSCCIHCDANDCTECSKESLKNPQNYIVMLDTIIQNNAEIFNKHPVVFTGHSLGGALSSIMAQKHNKLAVCFESPGDLRYIQMSGAGGGHSDKHVYHFGHNADSLFIGNCGSTCSVLGYYIQTKCHSGFTCEYNSQEKLGLRDSLWNHQINFVIDNIIPHWEKEMPECLYRKECSDNCSM